MLCFNTFSQVIPCVSRGLINAILKAALPGYHYKVSQTLLDYYNYILFHSESKSPGPQPVASYERVLWWGGVISVTESCLPLQGTQLEESGGEGAAPGFHPSLVGDVTETAGAYDLICSRYCYCVYIVVNIDTYCCHCVPFFFMIWCVYTLYYILLLFL